MGTRRLQVFTCSLLLLAAVSVSQGGDEKGTPEKQAAIKKLQKQRLEILARIARTQEGYFKSGTADFAKVAEAHRNVLLATVQLAETSEERVRTLGELQKLAEDLVKVTEARRQGAKTGEVDFLQAQTLVLEARIEILKEAKVEPRKK